MKCTKNRYNQKHFQLFTKKKNFKYTKKTAKLPCESSTINFRSIRYYLLYNAILMSITDKVVIKNVFT